MKRKDQVQKLLRSSRQVLKDVALPNGAIVAANSRKSYFPKEAKNYYFVWPRDSISGTSSSPCLAAAEMNLFISFLLKA